MKEFYGEELFIDSASAKEIYGEVKDLPVIDYHCHLDQNKIKADAKFSDIGQLWLAGDHYKWRAMRLCGVDEEYITGGAGYHDKFLKYAEIMPQLAGNPLYYWTHLELRQVFGICEPLNRESAERIYKQANERLKDISVGTLLKQYKVEYVATTDDPCDDLAAHGRYGATIVAPTFRPDKLLSLDGAYLKRLGEVAGKEITTLADLLRAAEARLQYFVAHGCRISDHGFLKFPSRYPSRAEAERLFLRREGLSAAEREGLFGYLLVGLAKLYKKYGIVMQLHFAVTRNVNAGMFKQCGADAGFDVIADGSRIEDIIGYFRQLSDGERPETILYTLNDSNLPALAALTGAYRHVKMGAAWWFNDTVQGIRKNLSVIAEYSVLGTNYGMLTDSRSFSSYARFDFFRRILSNYLGELVEKGEYDEAAAKELARNVCYFNIKKALGI